MAARRRFSLLRSKLAEVRAEIASESPRVLLVTIAGWNCVRIRRLGKEKVRSDLLSTWAYNLDFIEEVVDRADASINRSPVLGRLDVLGTTVAVVCIVLFCVVRDWLDDLFAEMTNESGEPLEVWLVEGSPDLASQDDKTR